MFSVCRLARTEHGDSTYVGSASSRDQPSSPIYFLSFLLLGMGKRGGYEADGRKQLHASDQNASVSLPRSLAMHPESYALQVTATYRPHLQKDQGYKLAKMSHYRSGNVRCRYMIRFVNVCYILRILVSNNKKN